MGIFDEIFHRAVRKKKTKIFTDVEKCQRPRFVKTKHKKNKQKFIEDYASGGVFRFVFLDVIYKTFIYTYTYIYIYENMVFLLSITINVVCKTNLRKILRRWPQAKTGVYFRVYIISSDITSSYSLCTSVAKSR